MEIHMRYRVTEASTPGLGARNSTFVIAGRHSDTSLSALHDYGTVKLSVPPEELGDCRFI
jgi:hypothetical protein